jgi:predicted transcriptional regulator
VDEGETMRLGYSSTSNPVLWLTSRKRIFDLIIASPGIHFREIQRRLQMATGALGYHLKVLQNSGVVKSETYGKFLRYYPIAFGTSDMSFLSALRQENVRKILVHLMLKPKSTHAEIVKSLSLSPSAISWYLRRLKSTDIVVSEVENGRAKYSVGNAVELSKLLLSYRASFLDNAVDNFVSAWTDL